MPLWIGRRYFTDRLVGELLQGRVDTVKIRFPGPLHGSAFVGDGFLIAASYRVLMIGHLFRVPVS
jgi:hypothetical protein